MFLITCTRDGITALFTAALLALLSAWLIPTLFGPHSREAFAVTALLLCAFLLAVEVSIEARRAHQAASVELEHHLTLPQGSRDLCFEVNELHVRTALQLAAQRVEHGEWRPVALLPVHMDADEASLEVIATTGYVQLRATVFEPERTRRVQVYLTPMEARLI